jgi:hypothetical protein
MAILRQCSAEAAEGQCCRDRTEKPKQTPPISWSRSEPSAYRPHELIRRARGLCTALHLRVLVGRDSQTQDSRRDDDDRSHTPL